jgi:hypothetical protein
MIPVPTRMISCRLTTTHAGYEDESTLLLEMYKRGLALPEIAPDLHAGNHLLFTWSHVPLAPWQTQEEMDKARALTRPIQYLRQYENRFVTSESAFIDMAKWDRIVDASLGTMPFAPSLPVYVGCDASFKHDSTAIVVVHIDTAQMVPCAFTAYSSPRPMSRCHSRKRSSGRYSISASSTKCAKSSLIHGKCRRCRSGSSKPVCRSKNSRRQPATSPPPVKTCST